jgi:prepilin-type N-terminal cleavage/methylation domain-containing protein
MNTKNNEKGFTLIEILVALAILTVISLSLVQFLAPWMAFKSKLDTDRKLMEMKTLMTTIYERNAWAVETNSGANFTFSGGVLTSSTLTSARSCNSQFTALSGLSSYFSDGLPAGENDGFGNTFCFLISPQLSTTLNGVNIYFHNIAVVSPGHDAQLDVGTNINPATGALTLGGDDTGILINGFTIQEKKVHETESRLARVGSLYESYFTARFLANPSRDVTIDYFANGNPPGTWDSTGSIGGTGGTAQSVQSILGNPSTGLGIGPEETMSSYEINNTLLVANYNECAAGACVRSSAGGGLPPFTALLLAPLPGPGANYLVKVATGNY